MGLDAVGIVSKDIPRTIRFYALLGLDLEECGGSGHFEAATDGGIRVMVDSVDLIRQIQPDWQAPSGSGITLCFLQESPAAVDDLHTRILQAGFESVKEPWDAFWGQRYATVKDPDGNQVDLFAAL
ncbi:MAG: VOC family protein [Candidatus Omnitrophica bacterium]|nr:VOC family protein [Candidatus Omnitrophota bacterium]